MKFIKIVKIFLATMFIVGCAGMDRSCSSCMASASGANWLVVQYKNDGTVMRCWKLTDVSISSEDKSDGVYWMSSQRNLIHISGWYNYVQVEGSWESAADDLNVDLNSCN